MKVGKHDFKLGDGFLSGNVGKQLSKMEEVLIMGLVVRRLGF